jgi:hypothetical protein
MNMPENKTKHMQIHAYMHAHVSYQSQNVWSIIPEA